MLYNFSANWTLVDLLGATGAELVSTGEDSVTGIFAAYLTDAGGERGGASQDAGPSWRCKSFNLCLGCEISIKGVQSRL